MPPSIEAPPSLYINIHTTDAAAAEKFFKGLGFNFISEFSDTKSRAFRLPEPNANVGVMIHMHERFKEFIRPNTAITDAHKETECLFSISLEKKEDVDVWINKVVELGGTADPFTMKDYGAECNMYSRSFTDLDGHIWEVLALTK